MSEGKLKESISIPSCFHQKTHPRPLEEEIARVLSYVFDGSVISIPFFCAFSFYFIDGIQASFVALGISILFVILIPYIYVLYLLKGKRISDIHISKRHQRIKPLVIANISYLLGYLLLLFLGISPMLSTIFLIYFITVFLLTVITLFWKISFHTSWITFFTITLFILFQYWALFSFLLIPLVAWSRIKLKKHTILQAISGSVLTGSTTLFVFYFHGYIF